MSKKLFSLPTFIAFSFIFGMLILSGSTDVPAEAAVEGSPIALDRTLIFDGEGDYVSIPHDAALRLSNGQFSIEAWIKPDDVDGCQTVVSKGFADDSHWLGICGGVLRFWANGASYDAVTPVPAGLWTHVAATKTTTGTLYLYINGETDQVVTGVGNPTETGTKPLTIGADPDSHIVFGSGSTRYEFDGKIANVRLWTINRSRNQIRRDMHTVSTSDQTGLLANWWLAGSYNDAMGGFDGSRLGNLHFDDTESPPAQPDYPAVNSDFDTGFGLRRAAAAYAYLPATDEWLILGGISNSSSFERSIRRFDPNTGRSRSLGFFPTNLADSAAAYVPATDRVYTFGGRTAFGGSGSIDTIYAVDPVDGTATTLTTTLPVPMTNLEAVYHPSSEKVLLLGGLVGGAGSTDAIHLFDPLAGTMTTLPQTLPVATYGMQAIYSPATESIFVFGGDSRPSDLTTILEIALNEDHASVSVTTRSAVLPIGDYNMGAVVDPISHLIYLLGGRQNAILAYDPLTDQIWETRLRLPANRSDAIVMYGRRQRAAYVMGGYHGFSIQNNLWRFPLGDGPAVPVGRWDFPLPVGTYVTALDGAADRMLVGTTGSRAWRYGSDGLRYQYTTAQVGTSQINDVDYDPVTGKMIFATQANGVKIDATGVIQTIEGGALGSSTALAVEYAAQTGEPLIGTQTQGLRRLENNSTVGFIWRENFSNQYIQDIERLDDDRVFVVINQDGSERLGRLYYGTSFGLETGYGVGTSVCGLDNPLEMTFGGDGSYWVAGSWANEFNPDAGVCYLPAGPTPSGGTRFVPLIGRNAVGIDTDMDGRVWVAINQLTGETGGAVVYESNSAVTTTEYNYLNAPLAGNGQISHGFIRPWDSSVSAVTANDERVWFGQPDGDLVTYAPRWDQYDDSNSMTGRRLENVWTVRGRLFAATSSHLHILQPDGQSWENLPSGKVWDVMDDSQGRIWVATQTGIRLYTSTGWDYLTDRVGSRPATAVYTLAEDLDGRIWIGGLHGLTLFDRDRFVATFDPATSGLPTARIRTLFVDSDNTLWIGTDAGLTRFDGTTWTTFTTASGLPDNRVADIEQIGDGRLAISTASGLSFYDGTAFTTQTLPVLANRLPLTVDENGRLWAGPVVEIGDGEWHLFSTLNSGLGSDEVSDHAADGADRIWFSHAPDFGLSVRSSYLPPLSDTVPVISSIEPAFGSAGDTITIRGSGFGRSYRDIDVFFGTGTATVDTIFSDRIEVTLNDDANSGEVVVKVGARQSAAPVDFCAIPVINDFTPTGGNVGVTVDILGTNFDPDARVSIGSAAPTVSFFRGPTHLAFDILPGDPNGVINVQNHCSGSAYQAASTGREFRRIDLVIDEVNLNQGINGMPLVADRPTMVSHFLRTTNDGRNFVPRITDEIDINQVILTFNEPGGQTWSSTINYDGPVPTSFLAINNLLRADITNSVNVNVTPDLDGDTGSPVSVSTVIRHRGRVVASSTTSRSFSRNRRLGILLVPIMDNGFSRGDLNGMMTNVNGEIEDVRRRMLPTGSVDIYWSNSAIEVGDLFNSPSQLDPGDFFRLYDSGHSMERFRRHWNRANPDRKVTIAFGVIDGSILVNNPSASGLAFWPDVSAMLNAMGLSAADTLCDIGDALIGILTLGAVGGGGCNLEVPMYVAWGASDTGRSSHLIGHEAGHVLGLVRPFQANGNLTDNFSHSVNDEIDGGECSTIRRPGSGAAYNINKTLYRQPGVQVPIVNPLNNGQWTPRLNVTTTVTVTQPTTTTITSEAFTMRAKAIMSYACGRGNRSSYFEPADVGVMTAGYLLAPHTSSDRSPASFITSGITATPRVVTGSRLFVSGVVGRTADTGELVNVEILGDSGPLDASYETGYWLVQKDAAGTELSRTGLFPIFESTAMAHHLEEGEPITPADEGFFAATVIAQAGLARLELVRESTVVDTFTAGSGVPTISISSPSGGKFTSGNITVKWTAGDPDGDSLSQVIYFSADNGENWVPVDFPEPEDRSVQIPVDRLVGAEQARFKVAVSDGFNQVEAISNPFKVAAQPPQPFIGAPADGATFLEGTTVPLSGGAFSNLGGLLPGGALRWSSSRDGDLGSGETIDAVLSVGTHTIELIATAPDGGKASTSIEIAIIGDYDFDGVADDEEMAEGFSLFDQYDGRSDRDQDGVPYLQERNWGTDPNAWDTDGDGRNDGREIEEGTDPAMADDPLPPDELQVNATELIYEEDRAVDTPDPQGILTVLSRDPVGWSVSASQSWIRFSKTNGSTPDAVTVIVEASTLENGTHTADITFTSSIGTRVIPVTVTVTNNDSPISREKKIYIPIISR